MAIFGGSDVDSVYSARELKTAVAVSSELDDDMRHSVRSVLPQGEQ